MIKGYIPKRNTHPLRGGIFWAKQTADETPKAFWRRQLELEKECNIQTFSAGNLIISKLMTAITEKKLRYKIMKEKALELNRTDQTEHL